jgi:type I restriction enzyme R subunit
MEDFSREEILEFKTIITKFINLYNLIIQVAPIIDSDLHRLSVYLRFLLKKINVESTGGVDITDKILLQYYKLEKKTEGSIYLEQGEDIGVNIKVAGGGQVSEPETDYLSNIINKLNDRFGTNFSESEKLAVEQIRNNLKINEELKLKAENNSYDDFKYAFEPSFLDGVIEEYDKNQEFYGKILQDDNFRSKLMDLIMLDIYASFKEKKNTNV